jgi:hypothetical protein
MFRHRLHRSVLAAVLALVLLLPAVAAARGPVLGTAPATGWTIPSGSLWDLLLRFLGKAPHLKNNWTIDPNGAQTDNHGTIDPDGAQTNNHGTIDPNG